MQLGTPCYHLLISRTAQTALISGSDNLAASHGCGNARYGTSLGDFGLDKGLNFLTTGFLALLSHCIPAFLFSCDLSFPLLLPFNSPGSSAMSSSSSNSRPAEKSKSGRSATSCLECQRRKQKVDKGPRRTAGLIRHSLGID